MLAFAVGSSLDFAEFAVLSISVLAHIAIIMRRWHGGLLRAQLAPIESWGKLEKELFSQLSDDVRSVQKSLFVMFVIGFLFGVFAISVSTSNILQSIVCATNSGSLLFISTVKLIASHYDENNKPLLNFFVFTSATALAFSLS